MRTKALLCAAALAAGALTSMAQVYSANVVGYVNVTLTGSGAYNLLANPLDATMGGTKAGGNNMTNILSGAAIHNGDQVWRWDVNALDFSYGTIATKGPSGWDLPVDLNPGEGFFYVNNSTDSVLTFVGQVNQGPWTYPGNLGGPANTVVGSGAYNAVGGPVPLGSYFTNSILGLTVANGDQVWPWSAAANDFDYPNITTKGPSGWDIPGLTIDAGKGLFYVRSGASTVWTANFTVQ